MLAAGRRVHGSPVRRLATSQSLQRVRRTAESLSRNPSTLFSSSLVSCHQKNRQQAPRSGLSPLLYAVEVSNEWLADSFLHQRLLAFAQWDPLNTESESPTSGDRGGSSASSSRSLADGTFPLILPQLASSLLHSSGINITGVHTLLFILLRSVQAPHLLEESGKSAVIDVIRETFLKFRADMDRMQLISESRTAKHIRLLAIACLEQETEVVDALKRELLTDPTLEVQRARLLDLDIPTATGTSSSPSKDMILTDSQPLPLPIDVLGLLLKIAPAPACQLFIRYQYDCMMVSRATPNCSPGLQPISSLEDAPPSGFAQIETTLSYFTSVVAGLLSNPRFASEQCFDSMHRALMNFVTYTNVTKESMFEKQSRSNQQTQEKEKERGAELPVIFEVSDLVKLLTRLSRLYGQGSEGKRAAQFFEFHTTLISKSPWIRPLISFRYYAWGLGMNVDAGMRTSRDISLVDEKISARSETEDGVARSKSLPDSSLEAWSRLISFLREALPLFTHPNYAKELWAMATKAARFIEVLVPRGCALAGMEGALDGNTVSRNSSSTATAQSTVPVDAFAFFRVLRVLKLFQTHQPQNNHLDYGGLKQTLFLLSQVLLITRDSSKRTCKTGFDFLEEQLPRKPYSLIEATASLLEYLKGHQANHQDAKAAAAEVYQSLKKALAKIGPGFAEEKHAPLRRLLEHFDVVPKSRFWWTCGCGESNVEDSIRCTSCSRSQGPTNSTCCWVCPKCQFRQMNPQSDGCGGCAAPHPAAVAKEAWLATLGKTEEDLRPPPPPQQPPPPRYFDCQSCTWRNKFTAVNCAHCGELNPGFPAANVTSVSGSSNAPLAAAAVPERMLWQCRSCCSYTFDIFRACSACQPAQTKPLQTLTFPYSKWTCGCGATNPITRVACYKCSAAGAGPKFTCPYCETLTEGTVNFQNVPSDTGNVKVRLTSCTQCGLDHPRDAYILWSSKLLARCSWCGTRNHLDQGGSEANSLCTACHVPLHNPLLAWGCSTCQRTVRGYNCPTCDALAPGIAAHQWRCDRLRKAGTTAGSELDDGEGDGHDLEDGGKSEGSSDGAFDGAELSLCGHWNPSWRSTCGGCGGSRANGPATSHVAAESTDNATQEEECRARYLPWTCPECNSEHKANVILLCPNCPTGIHTPPLCEKCNLPHVALACPSPALLQEASELVGLLEDSI